LVDRDDALRAACFLALDALRATHGDELPYAGGLDQGFVFDGRRVPFMNRYAGIHRAAAQRGRAVLSIQTSSTNPYADGDTDDGFGYAYRRGDVDQASNRALREASALQVPIVYLVGTRPGWFEAVYPCYVHSDDPFARRVLLSPGVATRLGESLPVEDDVERRYRVRDTRVRLHQARFRGLVLSAYRDSCAICRLREPRLLDASHIVPDADPGGVARVCNGLAFCTIHHRAYDHDLVGISPDYRAHVAQRLLDEEDGPMLEILKGADGVPIAVPHATRSRPDRELLAVRFERFGRA
jgi:putative restriction endonuclease